MSKIDFNNLIRHDRTQKETVARILDIKKKLLDLNKKTKGFGFLLKKNLNKTKKKPREPKV